MNAKELFELGNKLFSKRSTWMSLQQDIADNFYPERADFTYRREIGEHLAEYLSTSYPIMVRRDLGNQFGAMLRPYEKPWFRMSVEDEEGLDHESKQWLEWATKIQRRAMYDPETLFTRATKEGDHDFAAFGQCVLSVEMNRLHTALLYRCWHIRDVVWMENDEGKIGAVFRKWKPTARDLKRLFKEVHPGVTQKAEKDPYCEIEVMHIVVEADLYQESRLGYWSIFYDFTHDHVLEAVEKPDLYYVIPRWMTVSGSQYAYSPAAMTALPDARLLQAMTTTLLEAGEKAVTPPMIAVQEAIRSDVGLYAGAITWVDAAYDERMGEVMRPLTQDKGTIPLGIDMQRDTRAMLMAAFYLNKLTLPERAPDMTAYEVAQRIQQYIRDALPLFEPLEHDYNAPVCERSASLLMRHGAFGSPLDIPARLRGRRTAFRFQSPLHDAIEQEKGAKFLEAKAMLSEAVAIDQTAIAVVDAKAALRDVLEGIGVPAKWRRSEQDVEAYNQMVKQAIAEQQQLANMQAGSEIAKNTAVARKDMAAV